MSVIHSYLVSIWLDVVIHYHDCVMNYNDCCSLPRSREPLVTQPQMGSFSLLSPFSLLCSTVQMGSKYLFSALRIFCKANQGRGINCEDDYLAFRWVPQPCPEELFHCPLAGHNRAGWSSGSWCWEMGAGSPKDPHTTTPSQHECGEGALTLPCCAGT